MTLCTKRTEYRYGPSGSTPIENLVSDEGLLMARHNWTREEDRAVLYTKLTHWECVSLTPGSLEPVCGNGTVDVLVADAESKF